MTKPCPAKYEIGGLVLDDHNVTGTIERIEWSSGGVRYLVRFPFDRGDIRYDEDELSRKLPVYPKYVTGDTVSARIGAKYYLCVVLYVCRLNSDKVPVYRCQLRGWIGDLPPGVDPDARLMVLETDMCTEVPTGAESEVREIQFKEEPAKEPPKERYYNDGDKVWTWDIAIPVPIPCVVKVNYAMDTKYDGKYDLVTETEYRGLWEKGQQIDDVPVDEIYDSFDSAYLDLQSSRHQAGLSLMSEVINHLDTLRRDLEKARDTLR